MTILPTRCLDRLAAGADRADRDTDWPGESWVALREGGVLGRSIPTDRGGLGLSPVETLRGLEEVASACLTTAFILSQREAAVRRVVAGPPHLQTRYLPSMATGAEFLTVGLSQLTTSRLHTGPALRAAPAPAGYRLDGDVPWVTGADRADAFVVGATVDGGEQLLLVVPAKAPGLTVAPPMPLAALRGSRTSALRLDGVEVPSEQVLAGPAPSVLGPSGGGGLETSCLALGLARSAADFVEAESAPQAELREPAARIRAEEVVLRERLHHLAAVPEAEAILRLRVDCTRHALRATQAALLVAKGTGFVTPHPTSRWAGQALFFLVWSCPRAVGEPLLAGMI